MKRESRSGAAWFIGSVAFAGCTAGPLPTPPATFWPTAGLSREPLRSTTVNARLAAFPFGGGAIVGGSDGVAHQVTRDLAIGGDAGGFSFPETIGGRIHARYNPGTDYVAFHVGLGGGAMNNDGFVGYLSGDLGARGGYTMRSRVFEVWAGATGGFGGPIGPQDRSGGTLREPGSPSRVIVFSALVPTGHLAFDVGFIARPTRRIGITFDLAASMIFAHDVFFEQSPLVLYGGSIGVQYTFGGESTLFTD